MRPCARTRPARPRERGSRIPSPRRTTSPCRWARRSLSHSSPVPGPVTGRVTSRLVATRRHPPPMSTTDLRFRRAVPRGASTSPRLPVQPRQRAHPARLAAHRAGPRRRWGGHDPVRAGARLTGGRSVRLGRSPARRPRDGAGRVPPLPPQRRGDRRGPAAAAERGRHLGGWTRRRRRARAAGPGGRRGRPGMTSAPETQPARTSLAWQRTGLAMLLVAGLLARSAVLHEELLLVVSTAVVALAGLAVLGVVASRRLRATQAAAAAGGDARDG